MAWATLFMKLPKRSAAELRKRLDKDNRRGQARAFRNILKALVQGNESGSLRTQVSTAKASFTVTCAFASVTLDATTLTIGGVTFTVATTPALETDVANGASNDALAVNLAAKINAHSKLSEFCTAVAAATVVTVTIDAPGEIGNHIPVAEAQAGFTISGAFPTGGDSDELDEWGFGGTVA
jgi:phage tail sheath gpL-like